MKSELKDLNDHKTRTLVDLPLNEKILKCRWLYMVKTDENNCLKYFKARLIVQGFKQSEGIGYFGMLSPVVFSVM